MEKRLTFIEKLKAKIFKRPIENTPSLNKSTDLGYPNDKRRGSVLLPLPELNHTHSAK